MDLIFPLRTDKRENETGGLSSALGRTRVARGGGGWRRTDGETEGGTEGQPVGASRMGRVGPTGSEGGLPRGRRAAPAGSEGGLPWGRRVAPAGHPGTGDRGGPSDVSTVCLGDGGSCTGGPRARAGGPSFNAGADGRSPAGHSQPHTRHPWPAVCKKNFKSTTLNKIDFTNKYGFELLVEKTRKHSPPGSLNRLR